MVVFPRQNHPTENLDSEKVCFVLENPPFPLLSGANIPTTINKVLLDHFLPQRPTLSSQGRLTPHASHDPLTKDEIAKPLAKSSPSSGPSPNEVPYSLWKKVNRFNPEIASVKIYLMRLHQVLKYLTAFAASLVSRRILM